MKHSFAISLFAAAFAIQTARGEEFSIPWFTLDGSSSSSQGGAYSLAGSIGQFQTSTSMIGGAFTLEAAPRNIIATVPSPGGPMLRIQPDGDSIIVVWPNPSEDFELQETASLTPPAWGPVTIVPSQAGPEKQVRLPLQAGHRFFRLHKP